MVVVAKYAFNRGAAAAPGTGYLGRDLNAYVDASAIDPTGGPVARTDTEATRRKERLDPTFR